MESFFQGWMERQEQLLDELVAAQCGGPGHELHVRELIGRVISHYKSYYNEKSRLAQRDVLLVYSPSWLTPFERTFLWIAGWKPSLAFRLLRSSANGEPLSSEQIEAVKVLEQETQARERELAEDMVNLQEGVAMPNVLHLLRRMARARNGEARGDEVAMEAALLTSLESLVKNADRLRAKVVKRFMEILSPVQTVGLLVAAAQLHLHIREWGLQRGRGGRGATAAAATSERGAV